MPDNKMKQYLSVAPGTEYDYAPITLRQTEEGPTAGRWVQGRYRVLGVGRDARTMQESVIYQGVDGKDNGLIYHCSLSDFALKFIPVKVPQPEQPPAPTTAPAPPGKTVGHISTEGSEHGMKQFIWTPPV